MLSHIQALAREFMPDLVILTFNEDTLMVHYRIEDEAWIEPLGELLRSLAELADGARAACVDEDGTRIA